MPPDGYDSFDDALSDRVKPSEALDGARERWDVASREIRDTFDRTINTLDGMKAELDGVRSEWGDACVNEAQSKLDQTCQDLDAVAQRLESAPAGEARNQAANDFQHECSETLVQQCQDYLAKVGSDLHGTHVGAEETIQARSADEAWETLHDRLRAQGFERGVTHAEAVEQLARGDLDPMRVGGLDGCAEQWVRLEPSQDGWMREHIRIEEPIVTGGEQPGEPSTYQFNVVVESHRNKDGIPVFGTGDTIYGGDWEPAEPLPHTVSAIDEQLKKFHNRWF